MENEEKQELYVNERKNLIAEFESNLNWLNFNAKEKRFDFILLLIRKELKSPYFIYDENVDYKIQAIHPKDLFCEDSDFTLRDKNNPFIIRIKSTMLFAVFFPLLNKHKIEYLNSLITQGKPLANFSVGNDEPSANEENKENRTLILNKLEEFHVKESLRKCLRELRWILSCNLGSRRK
ncbi:MAG TPA: hypothetical protein VF411_09220 [Bacteroidia bacterium]